MKIQVVCHAWPPEGRGGTERYAAVAARGLADRGHEVRVFAGSLAWKERRERVRTVEDGLPVTRVHRQDLYFDQWDKPSNPHVAAWFEEELDGWSPDVVHHHHWIRLGLDLVRRSAARGVPVLGHLHDLFVTCPRVFRVREDGERCEEPMPRAPCLTCVPRWPFQGDGEVRSSLEQYASHCRQELGAARRWLVPSKAHADVLTALVPDLSGLAVLEHPRLSRPWPAVPAAASPAGRLRVWFFSELHPVKGLHVVLEAMRRLGPDSGISLDAHGAFVSPDYEEHLHTLADGQDVRFHGAYQPPLLPPRGADVIVLPFQARESYSFLLDEALDCGLPLLVSDLGALGERAGARARRLAPGDPAAWAEALRDLRDSPALRSGLAEASGKVPLDREQHLERLEQHLDQVRRQGPCPVAPLAAPADLVPAWERREDGFQRRLRGEEPAAGGSQDDGP